MLGCTSSGGPRGWSPERSCFTIDPVFEYNKWLTWLGVWWLMSSYLTSVGSFVKSDDVGLIRYQKSVWVLPFRAILRLPRTRWTRPFPRKGIWSASQGGGRDGGGRALASSCPRPWPPASSNCTKKLLGQGDLSSPPEVRVKNLRPFPWMANYSRAINISVSSMLTLTSPHQHWRIPLLRAVCVCFWLPWLPKSLWLLPNSPCLWPSGELTPVVPCFHHLDSQLPATNSRLPALCKVVLVTRLSLPLHGKQPVKGAEWERPVLYVFPSQ